MSFVKIAEAGYSEFSPTGNIGYGFRYKPRYSSDFMAHFLSPSFGPELQAFEINENTTIGVGLFMTTFYNMVKLGVGYTVNGTETGKPYVSFGLDFVKSYDSISNLVAPK